MAHAETQAFCYVGHNDNPSFIGSEPIDALGERIWQSVGPSGRNKDYLYELSAAVKRLAPESHDSHLFALETRCRELDAERGDYGITQNGYKPSAAAAQEGEITKR